MYFDFGKAFDQVLNTNIKTGCTVKWDPNFEQQTPSDESEEMMGRRTELRRLNLTVDSNEWPKSLIKIAAICI